MSAEDEFIQRVAAQLEQDAPAISLDEIAARTHAVPVPVADVSQHNGRRWTPIVLAVAAAALTTGGIALALTSRSPAPTLQTGGTAVADNPVPSTAPTSTTQPASQPSTAPTTETVATTASPTTVPAESAGIELDGDQADVMAAIDADRFRKLRTLQGFTATIRKTNETVGDDGEPIDSQPGFDSRTTLLADGSMWSEIDGGGFASYDATTGESRGAILMPSGDMYYQLIEGWTENSTGLAIMLGHDPTQLLTEIGMPGSFVFDETVHDQRPAWRIVTTYEPIPRSGEIDASAAQTSTFVIDKATGLIVASATEWESRPGERSRQASELVDIEIVDEMPAAFPGAFPEGATIDRSGDPSAFQPLMLSDAADWFGAGFLAPPDVPADTEIFVNESMGDPANPQSLSIKNVEIRAREGFVTTWRMFVSKDEIGPGGEIPDGYLLVDGIVCADFDQDGECGSVMPNDSEPLTNAALDGFSSHEERSSITLQRNGLTVVITGSPAADARSVAETLIAW